MTLNEILKQKGQTSLHDKLLEKTVERVSLAKGDTGEIGPQGPVGPQGPKGDKGNDGGVGKMGPIGKSGKDGIDGKDGQNGIDGKTGKAGKDGTNGSPDTGKEIVAKINDLPLDAKFKIDASHIKNLPKEKKAIHRGGNDVFVADLSASLNGSTKAFSIPVNNGVLLVVSSSAPFIFKPITDFTGSGTSTITFTANVDAPSMLATSQYLFVLYK